MSGGEIKRMRRAVGLLQAEVASELGVDKQTVSRWETGAHKIPRNMWMDFLSLIWDIEMVEKIKALRPPRIHGRPFQKK